MRTNAAVNLNHIHKPNERDNCTIQKNARCFESLLLKLTMAMETLEMDWSAEPCVAFDYLAFCGASHHKGKDTIKRCVCYTNEAVAIRYSPDHFINRFKHEEPLWQTYGIYQYTGNLCSIVVSKLLGGNFFLYYS